LARRGGEIARETAMAAGRDSARPGAVLGARGTRSRPVAIMVVLLLTFTGLLTLSAAVGSPGAPTAVAGTAGAGEMTLSWVAPASDGSLAITDYELSVYSGSGGAATGVMGATTRSVGSATTGYTFTGLSNGTAYTFKVAAVNAIGAGSQSALSEAVIVGSPVPPTGVTAVKVASGQIRVTFTAGANNGSTTTSYTATCTSSNGGVAGSKTGAASPLTVTGLTAAKTYTCTVKGTNARGAGLSSAPSVGPLNIVFVLTDDMRPDEMTMTADLKPNGGFDWVRDHGVRFSKYISTDNLCCPGRTTALTGKTSYNHGVQSNENRHTDLRTDSLPTYLSGAGYCTAFTGKYHINNPKIRPGGWTYWQPAFDGDEYGYSILGRNGTAYQPPEYLTDGLQNVARFALRDCIAAGKSAAVALWPVAPHFGFDPEPDYSTTPVTLTPQDLSFNEPDMSDKPAWLRSWFPTTSPASYYANIRTNRVRTLLSVDDALKGLIADLSFRGELSNTLFVLTSDNGFLLGEHRVESRKRLAYEAAQPGLWIAGPGFPVGVASDAFAANVDLVPTLVKASGPIPWTKLDGRALQDVLLEPDLGHDRFLPIHVPIETADVGKQPTGDAVRTWRYKYVKYADGSEELYDLVVDPFEQGNVANTAQYQSVKAGMQSLLPTAKACKADNCRVSAPLALQK
jgi:N-acetylglucosamine-6-sulfatase